MRIAVSNEVTHYFLIIGQGLWAFEQETVLSRRVHIIRCLITVVVTRGHLAEAVLVIFSTVKLLFSSLSML